MNQTRPAARLHIGSLIFPRVDQIDFTGPFEVVGAVRAAYQPLTDARLTTARRIRAKLGIEVS